MIMLELHVQVYAKWIISILLTLKKYNLRWFHEKVDMHGEIKNLSISFAGGLFCCSNTYYLQDLLIIFFKWWDRHKTSGRNLLKWKVQYCCFQEKRCEERKIKLIVCTICKINTLLPTCMSRTTQSLWPYFLPPPLPYHKYQKCLS